MRTLRPLIAIAVLMLAGFGIAVVPATAQAATTPSAVGSTLPLPSDALASTTSLDGPRLIAMSCGSPGFCVATGQYTSQSGYSRGLIETWSHGGWTARSAPLPPAVTANAAIVAMVACAGIGTCVAEGEYTVGSTRHWAAMALHNGTWGAVAVAPPDGYLLNGSEVTGVGCSAEGSCALVGNYADGSHPGGLGFYDIYSGSAWMAPQEAKQSPDHLDSSSANYRSDLNGLACGGGHCQAVGAYNTPAGMEPLVNTIDPAAGTANAPSAHPPLPTLPNNITSINDLNGVGCASTGCTAYGTATYTGSDTFVHNMEYLEPLGGAGFSPQVPPTLTPSHQSTTPSQFPYALGCGGNGCLLTGTYIDTSQTSQPMLDTFAGTWVANHAPSPTPMTEASCGATTFCVATTNPGTAIEVLNNGTWQVINAHISPSSVSNVTMQAMACDSATSCWAVGDDNGGVSGSPVPLGVHITPTSVVPPPMTVGLTGSWAPFTLGASATLTWHGKAGANPISHYVVQVRRAAWNGTFGSWTSPGSWASVPVSASSIAVPLPVGSDTCVRVKAVDSGGASTPWTAPRCTARPIDDRALTRSAGWTLGSGPAFYLGTFTASTHSGAKLTRTGAMFDRLALVATTCPTCGKVAVYSGATLLGTLNLYAATTVHRTILLLPPFSLRSATITLKIITSGKTVQVDGLGVSRT